MLSAIHSVDWTAALLALAAVSGCTTPWLMLRNIALPELLTRVVHEEKEWLDQHPAKWDGHFYRYESLPSYGRMLLSLWKPVKEFEAELKPVAEYYKEK